MLGNEPGLKSPKTDVIKNSSSTSCTEEEDKNGQSDCNEH